MNRIPIRWRLTVAFAVAMLVMLAGAALFVTVRLRDDIDDRITASLRARAVAATNAWRNATPIADVAIDDPEESFVQVVDPSGRVLDTAGTARGPVLSAPDRRRALQDQLSGEAPVRGIDGPARFVTRTAGAGEDRVILIIGQSVVDRTDALSSVITSFVIGGAIAILAASAIGLLLARAGLAPVDAMGREARTVSFHRGPDALALPAAHDEIRRLGETLNEMLGRLRDSYEREQRFVADASHELRTPIAVLRTELEGAQASGDFGPAVGEALDAAIGECGRLTRLADDLLVLARASDGAVPVAREPVDLARAVAEATTQFAAGAARDSRPIVTEVAPDLVVSADPMRLRQVLVNLVDNALRHGAGTITIRAAETGSGVEISVVDEGPGFPADFAPHAFERFSRTVPSAGPGAGLGLALVSAIATAHGGTATIDRGAPPTVRVVFPRHPAA